MEGTVKVLALNGSPRRNGNTELLLEAALRGIREQGGEAAVYRLNTLNLKPCQSCGGCAKNGVCVIGDDMARISADIRASDRIVLASPVYFFSVSAQAKIVIDRCQSFWIEKYILKKPVPPGPAGRKGLLILTGGMKRAPNNPGYDCAEAVARSFFRTVNVQEHATLAYDAVDAKGAIREHPTALEEAYRAGRALAGR